MLILIAFLFLCFHSNHLGGSDNLEKKSIVNIDNFFKKHDLISRKCFEIHIQKLQIILLYPLGFGSCVCCNTKKNLQALGFSMTNPAPQGIWKVEPIVCVCVYGGGDDSAS